MPAEATSPSSDAFGGRTVLVTGGAGFIGSHLVHGLLRAGAHVRVLDDLSTGAVENLPPEVDFVRGTITDGALVRDAVKGCAFVFHLAAMVSVPASVADPDQCFRVNVQGTDNALRAAAAEGVDGFVHASSAAVYGLLPALPSKETDPIQCESPYAASKACGEFLVQAAARTGRVPGASLRLFNVFGPRQDPRNPYAAAVCAFMDAAAHHRTVRIFGTGRQTRDFVPVEDVVSAFLLAARKAVAVRGEAFNVGLGVSTSIVDLATMICRAAGSRAEPEFLPPRAGDVEHSCACLERSRDVLEFRPAAHLREALAAMVPRRLAR